MTYLSGGKTLDEIITVHTEDYTGTPVACTPDRSRWVVANLGGKTGTVVLDREGNCVTPLFAMPGTFGEKYVFSEDGKLVACVSIFGFVACWDVDSGDLLYFNFEDSEDGAYVFSDPVFSPDGEKLTYVVNHKLCITDARTGAKLVEGTMDRTNFTPVVAYSADGEYIFVLDQTLYIVDAQGRLYGMLTSDQLAPFNNVVQLGERMLVTRNDGRADICLTPANSSMKTVSRKEMPRLCLKWDPHQPPEGNRFTGLSSQHELTEAFRQTTVLTDLTPKLWYSTDGKRCALSYPDGVIEIFEDPDSGEVSTMLGQLTREITAVAISERHLIASDAGGQILFYDLEKGQVIRIHNGGAAAEGFAFNMEQDMLMELEADGDIKVYDIAGAEELFVMRTADPFTDFRFAADGSSAVGVTGSGALVASLWTDEEALLSYARSLVG
jgi:WD40 repeat protein